MNTTRKFVTSMILQVLLVSAPVAADNLQAESSVLLFHSTNLFGELEACG